MPTVGQDGLASRCIPDLYSLIHTCRGDEIAIWRPAHGTHLIRMTVIGYNASSSIPDLHSLIPGARGDELTIGRPCHRIHSICVTVIGVGKAFQTKRFGNGGSHSDHTLVPKL